MKETIYNLQFKSLKLGLTMKYLYKIFLAGIISIVLIFQCNAQVVSTLNNGLPNNGGIAVDNDGNIYAANFNGSVVWKVTPEGSATIFASGFQTPSGNYIDSEGNLYQSNYRDQANPTALTTIDKITPNGVKSVFATGMNGPVGITIDSLGNLFVAMCNINSVYKITSGGVVSMFATSNLFACPNGITFDDEGNLYVCNFSNGDVLKITTGGVVSLLATLPGANNGHLDYLDGFLYVAARGANQIYKVSLTGEVTLFAGTGQQAVIDGPALKAAFSLPNAITFSPTANAFYTNGSASVIRKIQLETTGLNQLDGLNPAAIRLEQNYPNPFNPMTKISYSIPQSSYVTLIVYDVLGNEIASLVNEEKVVGIYEVEFSAIGGSDSGGNAYVLPSGIYFYKLQTGFFVDSKKMILLK
jgi:sugar lactone lactonase YvrE